MDPEMIPKMKFEPGLASAPPMERKALGVQVGGNHYKDKAIQPVEYIAANRLNFLEGCIVKRITRWRDKNGLEDLLKIKHEVDLLIQMEEEYPSPRGSKRE